MKNLWIKKQFFDLIVQGKKTLEVRVSYPGLKKIKKGDVIGLNNKVKVKIKDIRTYSDFEKMILNEDPNAILPESTSEQVLNLLKKIYPPKKQKLGVIVFELDVKNKRN